MSGAKGWVQWSSPQQMMEAARMNAYPREAMQVAKRQTGFCYNQGPMFYLGQQIVKAMQDAGRPAKIVECYRPPERQAELYAQGRTKAGPKVTQAGPWQSAHQFLEAVDIVHPSLGWDVSEAYWDTLASCVVIVSEKFGVHLVHGHHWRFRDSAHIELPDWRFVQAEHQRAVLDNDEERPPNEPELWARFNEVLPAVARRVASDGRAPASVNILQWVSDIITGLCKK